LRDLASRMTECVPQFTPVTLITGFLGSGKTTLLRHLLADPAMADTAVLINEFGEVGLDHQLLERIDERMVLLQSGCLCCTVRGELADAVRDLHSRRARGTIPTFGRMVIESTGLADPFPVLTTFYADPVLKHHFRMAGVVATVDAVNGARQLAQHAESVKQVAVADRIVLTKTDLADVAGTLAVERRVRAINPDAPLLRGLHGAETLLTDNDAGSVFRNPVTAAWIADEVRASEGRASRHAPDIEAFAIVLERSVDWTAFGLWLTMLLHRHGSNVLRVKGILNVTGTDTPVAIHGVQQLVHAPTHMQTWPDDDRRSKLVFIVQDLDPVAIRRSLESFCGAVEARPKATVC
jgi:G3E family GTPase